MPEFLKLLTPDEARSLLLRNLPDRLTATEAVDPVHALGRVAAEEVRAEGPLPAFLRSTVDGYAVRALDTFGVSESMPGYLALAGEVPMGAQPAFALGAGQVALIHTGGMLPVGANAVIMLEHSQVAREGELEIMRAVAEGENVILVGEDVAEGQVVLPRGRRIGPAEIGGLMALGIHELRIATRPKVGIISSGDEVIPPQREPVPGQVRDINSYSLAALVTNAGGEPVLYGIVPDRLDLLKSAAAKSLAECELVVITAGSSASARDMTAEAIGGLGTPGVLVHGINIRPGKPTILGVCKGRAVIGLPGNPVSALVIAGLFVVPVIDKLLGVTNILPRPSLVARLGVNVSSQAGREDWVAVRLTHSGEGWRADPIFAKSNLIFSLVSADGLICIPPDVTGLGAGEKVSVQLF